MEPTAPPKRRRGGQPGNANATKHGFYSRHFKRGELDDLDLALTTGLEDEIKMLRVVLRRTLELADGVSDIEDATKTLNVLGAAATRLAGLLRTQKYLDGSGGDAAMAISQALTDIIQEMGLNAN